MSKPLKVWSAVDYLTSVDAPWRDNDWTCNRIIKGVKGTPFDGHFRIKIQGSYRKFEQSNIDQFVEALLKSTGTRLKTWVNGEFDLVPIPNSNATVKGAQDFKTLSHARAIAAAAGSGITALPALRWAAKKLPAHEGGTRDPQTLFGMLKLVEQPTKPVVLFDDVMTTGAQMIAAYRRLAETSHHPILGVVIGRTTREQREKPIGWRSEEIETEEKTFDLSDLF